MLIEGNFSIGTSASAKGKIGFIISANPGGPLAKVEFDDYIAASNLDIGYTGGGYGGLNFTVKLRPVSNYDSTTEDHTGVDLNRTLSILSEGVSYEFYVTPYYYGNLSPSDLTADYNQYIWGATTRAPESTFTAGLQTNAINTAFDNLFNANDPANILDRSDDYPDIVTTITSAISNNATSVSPSGVTGYWKIYTMATAVAPNVSAGDTVTVAGSSTSSFNGTFQISSFSTDRKSVYIVEPSPPTAPIVITGTGGTMTKASLNCKPLIQFMSVEHLGTPTTTKHPYVTAGQGPVDSVS